MTPTNGAFFLAKVINEACERSCNDDFPNLDPIPWKELEAEKKAAIAGGIQRLIDLGILNPISLTGVGILKRHRWKSVQSSQRPE